MDVCMVHTCMYACTHLYVYLCLYVTYKCTVYFDMWMYVRVFTFAIDMSVSTHESLRLHPGQHKCRIEYLFRQALFDMHVCAAGAVSRHVNGAGGS